jgi:hypothetical protein
MGKLLNESLTQTKFFFFYTQKLNVLDIFDDKFYLVFAEIFEEVLIIFSR